MTSKKNLMTGRHAALQGQEDIQARPGCREDARAYAPPAEDAQGSRKIGARTRRHKVVPSPSLSKVVISVVMPARSLLYLQSLFRGNDNRL